MREYRIRCRLGGPCLSPFIVATPRPYVVDLSGFADADGARAGLLAQVEVLRSVMAALGKGEVEAYRRGYSLNGPR